MLAIDVRWRAQLVVMFVATTRATPSVGSWFTVYGDLGVIRFLLAEVYRSRAWGQMLIGDYRVYVTVTGSELSAKGKAYKIITFTND